MGVRGRASLLQITGRSQISVWIHNGIRTNTHLHAGTYMQAHAHKHTCTHTKINKERKKEKERYLLNRWLFQQFFLLSRELWLKLSVVGTGFCWMR